MAKILIVDDRPTNREFLVTLLGYGGHALLEAADGAEALAMAQAEHPDLIITDILMPTMDGYQLVHQLRQDPGLAATPVIFYTAHYREQEALNLARACGVAAVLTKPTNPEAIQQAVQAALGLQVAIVPPTDVDFEREHMRVVTDKLANQANELRRTNARLGVLVDLGLQLGSELDIRKLLQTFSHAARDLIGARYAITAIRNAEEPSLHHLYTSGMSAEPASRLGAPDPQTELLRPTLVEGRCLRLQSPGSDARLLGFPSAYPSIQALLVAPIVSPKHIYGWLALIDKIGADAFSDEDERLGGMLAAQLGRIYQNGSLYAEILQRATELEHEVAERKRAEQQLRLQGAALDSAADGIAIFDLKGNTIWVNPAFTRMTGYSLEEIRGQNPRILKSGKHDGAFYAELWRNVLAGKVWFGELVNRRKDGTLYYEEQTITPVRNENGQLACFIAIKHDITARKQVEMERDRIFEQSLSLLCIAGFDGHFKRVNPAWETTLGYTRDELVGQPFMDLIHADDRSRAAEEVRKLAAGQLTISFLIRVLSKDGSYKWTAWNATPFLDQGTFYATGLDVTEQRLAQEALATQARLASLGADVGIALTSGEDLRTTLQRCAESMVRNLDAAFARIWTLEDHVLELQASAGLYTHLDGPHGRVPVGQFKIGLIAHERKPHLTNDVLHDPRLGDPEWARREGMVAFARHPLADSVLGAMESVARPIALGIDRKRTEAQRDHLLARLQMQIDRMPMAYVLLDAELRVVEWNRTAEQMFGYAKEEVVGVGPPYEKFIPAASWPIARAALERARAGDMSAHNVNENHTRDGRVIICAWFNTPLFDREGNFAGLIALGQDITDRKWLEEQYQQAISRLRYVVASNPAVLYTLIVENNSVRGLSWISDNVTDMLGYTVAETQPENWWIEHIHPEDLRSATEQIEQNLFTRGAATHEYRFGHRDGSYRWLRGEIRLLRDGAGQTTEAVGSWSDITERKQLEEQYRQAQKMEAVGRLAGGVAHDFNNLLTIIMGYSDLALAKLRTEDPLRLPLAEIHKAGERATGLTRQLLAFSRKQVLAPAVINLNTIIAGMEKMLQRLIGEDVALSVVTVPDLWPIKADPGQMEQVIMNIVINARDAMPEGGKLLLETKNVDLVLSYVQSHAEARSGEHVLLAISDTGVGMEEAVKTRIFEPFFTTKGPTKGTGLGLATVFGIIKQSGGHVEVYSEVGYGTTFKIYLPRDQGGSQVKTASHAHEPTRGGRETILLVEDEEGVRALAMMVLQEQGYTVLDAAHGGDALLICETLDRSIDLMITDVIMPHFSGRQLAERLASRQPNMKVLFMSGYTDDAIVHLGVLDAGTPFLQKPFSPDALVRKVREVLDAPRPAGRAPGAGGRE